MPDQKTYLKLTPQFLIGISSVLFALFLASQQALVFPYHDDWGYAVLTYTTEQTGFTGRNFDINQLISFLAAEYQNWSGRFGAFFLQISLFKLGLNYVRLYQVLSILATLYLAIKISAPHRKAAALTLLPIIIYLSLPRHVLVGGVYWYSAASGYMWGIPFLFAGAYLASTHNRITIGSSLLLAVSTTFHELMAVVVISFVGAYSILYYIEDKQLHQLTRNVICAIPALSFALTTLLAPGNFRRQSVSHYKSDNMIDVIVNNAERISTLLFHNSHAFSVLLITSFAILLLRFMGPNIKSKKNIMLLLTTAAAATLLFKWNILIFTVLFLFAYGLLLFNKCSSESNGKTVLALYSSAVASLTLLLLAPGVAGRALISFYFIMITPIIFTFGIIRNKELIYVSLPPVMAALLLGIPVSYKIYKGYEQNYQVNTINDAKLSALSYDIKKGSSLHQVSLYKLPSPAYAATMPYQRPLIEKWIKKYYELPQDVSFLWIDPRTKGN